jgi:hypothetical protein
MYVFWIGCEFAIFALTRSHELPVPNSELPSFIWVPVLHSYCTFSGKSGSRECIVFPPKKFGSCEETKKELLAWECMQYSYSQLSLYILRYITSGIGYVGTNSRQSFEHWSLERNIKCVLLLPEDECEASWCRQLLLKVKITTLANAIMDLTNSHEEARTQQIHYARCE